MTIRLAITYSPPLLGDLQEFVFRASSIEITVVDADPYLPVLLEDGNDISNLIWMLFFPYEATCNELMDFSLNSFHNIWAKLTLLLLDWLGVGLDVQTVHGDLWIESGHVFVAPCEDVYILFYEYYQFFLFCK